MFDIKFVEPDIVLEVQERRYVLDGKDVRKSDLHDALTRAASQGRKVLEIRAGDSIKKGRILFAIDVSSGTGIKVVEMKVQNDVMRIDY